MADRVRTTTLLPPLMESTAGITPEEITGASFGPFQRVRIICLDSRLNTAMASERNILLHQNPTFEHVQQELAAKEPEWTVLQPIYGPNPYWKHADQNSSIGATCRSLYAINRSVNRRYILAVVRTSQSDRPLPIFETPEATIQAIVTANPVLENKIESFTRYSDLQDARTELFDYDRLEERERFSFPTAFILTMREPPQEFRCTVPSAIIPPFLQIPFVNCKNLLRLTYSLELFPLQKVHVSRALLHAIISLAEAFKPVQTKDPSDPHSEDVREVALVLADELKRFLDSLTQIVKHGDEEGFNQSNNQNTINQIFITLCGDYPGAVTIRRSHKRFEELKELDREEAELLNPTEAVHTIEEGPVLPGSEQDELVGRSDTTPVEPVRNTKERPGVRLTDPVPVIRDSPMETVRMVDKGHFIPPIEGFDVGEEGPDSFPVEKVTDGASRSFAKNAGNIIEAARSSFKAPRMQQIVPTLLAATSWAAPLVEFRGVAVETVDKGPVTNPVEAASDNTIVPLIAANLSHQTIAHENITSDIDAEISEYRTTLETTTDGDLNKPMLLNHLAVRLESRFRRSDTVDDLQEAASSLQTAVELTPDDHPAKPALLTNLGNVLQTRSVRIGDLADVNKAISSLKNAAELTPDDHPNKPSLLYSLGSMLLSRFRRIGNFEDLNQAISFQQTAVELTPDDYLDRHTLLNGVGNALRIRFERLGDLEDIRRAIASLEIAANLTPNQHPDKAGSLSDLGTALQSQFDWLGILEDLENAISNLQQADQLTHDGDPDKPARLSNLGNALKSRFDCVGGLADLEDAILNQQKAVELTPDGHPNKPGRLNSLRNALETRFNRLGALADLEDAILDQQKAIELTPDGHPSKPGRLNSLCAPDATVVGHNTEAMATTEAKPDTPSDSKSNDIARNEGTNREVQPPDVAPQDTVRPPMKVDYAFLGPGETSPLEEPITAFISPSSNRASLLVEPEPIGDRREDSHAASTSTIRRKALLIGILYTDERDPDWNHIELSTPWDDVTKMKLFLENKGYKEDCIKILSDSPEAKRQGLGLPERDGIVEGINWLVNDARPGDYLFLHYCGHGYQIPADNYLELDGMDEVIIPLNADKNYLTDNELYNRLVVPLPVGCKLMAVWDCYHAGTMLDLDFEYEQTETRDGSQRKTLGGPSNRYKRQTAPRKTAYPLTTENRIKILRTVKRSPTSETHDSYELEVSHPTPMAVLEFKTVPTANVPGRQVDMSAAHPARPSSSYEQRPMPSRTSTTVIEQTRSSTMNSDRTEEVGSPRKNQVWTDATAWSSSPESMEPPMSLPEFYSTQTSTIPEETLHFFTTRTIDGIRKHESFGLPNHQPSALAQVISVAACYDDQSVFEILPGDSTPTNKPKTTGGLLTTTFIEFMERKSPQKTLDDMLHYLSEAFIRETKRMHSLCCSCGNQCGKEECRIPTDKASARKGQCVYKDCLIPTIPPNPLVSTLTDKRRQTIITV